MILKGFVTLQPPQRSADSSEGNSSEIKEYSEKQLQGLIRLFCAACPTKLARRERSGKIQIITVTVVATCSHNFHVPKLCHIY